ncbi:hypothetical protein PRZ48_006788 [Zasmidium cellare]|uniref:Rhodopsin domain-containing protein n=1 Tax=Zasmidium cellare TaxID=395010 RepID=A0ABR0EHM4_ZASCE|nr:hypothetical protein PRZ48_006788 [Zasmidium cellare]
MATSTISPQPSHPYLGDRQLDAIESWKTSVQAKQSCSMRGPGDDPVVEAYLRTKMALFQSLVSAKDPGGGEVGRMGSEPRGMGRLVRIIGLDDYIILLSLILAWVQCGLIAAAVYDGVGSYNSESAAVDTVMIAKLIVAMNSVWAVTVNITKASILVQYLRVFNGHKTRMCCWLLMAALLPAALWGVFGGIFLCNPTAKLFNPNIPGHCRSAQTYWVSVAAVNIGLDFLTLLLPIPSISGLHLPRKQKLLTMMVFLLGFLICLVSVTRLAIVLITSAQGDFIMSGIWAIIWSVVEANVGIICASLLALKCLVIKLFPSLTEEGGIPSQHIRIPEISTTGSETEWASGDSQVATLGERGHLEIRLHHHSSSQDVSAFLRFQPPRPGLTAYKSHLRTWFDSNFDTNNDSPSSHTSTQSVKVLTMAPQNPNPNAGDGFKPSKTCNLIPTLSWWDAQANPYTAEEMEAASKFAKEMIEYMRKKRAEKMAREIEAKGETGGGGGGEGQAEEGADGTADPPGDDVKKHPLFHTRPHLKVFSFSHSHLQQAEDNITSLLSLSQFVRSVTMDSNQDPKITQADLTNLKKRPIDANMVRDKITALKQAQKESYDKKVQESESKQRSQQGQLDDLKAKIKQMEDKRAEKKAQEGKSGGEKGEVKTNSESATTDAKKGNQAAVPAKAETGGSGGNGYYRDIEGDSDDEGSDDDYDDDSEGFDDEVRYGQATGQGWL